MASKTKSRWKCAQDSRFNRDACCLACGGEYVSNDLYVCLDCFEQYTAQTIAPGRLGPHEWLAQSRVRLFLREFYES